MTPAGGRRAKLGELIGDAVLGADDNASGSTDASSQIHEDCSALLDNVIFATGTVIDNDHHLGWRNRSSDSTLEHGTPSGSFTPGNTLTGVSSGATATIIAAGSGFLQVGAITGTYEVGEVVGDTAETATLTHPTIAAGGDPAQDVRRFATFEFRSLVTGALVGNAVSTDFTYAVLGDEATS